MASCDAARNRWQALGWGPPVHADSVRYRGPAMRVRTAAFARAELLFGRDHYKMLATNMGSVQCASDPNLYLTLLFICPHCLRDLTPLVIDPHLTP